jgi:hypothetical protein
MCCGENSFTVEGNKVQVKLGEHRHHFVEVKDAGDALELKAIVARRKTTIGISNLAIRVWQSNRGTQLLGFKVDKYDRLIGEAWVPKVGLTAEELRLYIKRVASECDRFEYLLTGKDRE